jgi:hypothetical protein
MNSMRDQNHRNREDDGKVRTLFERGDMGYKPGGKFPYVDASTERGQIWLAAMGNSVEAHDRSQSSWARQPESTPTHLYRFKEWNRKKSGQLRTLESRKGCIVDTTMDDPLIAPRDITKEEYFEIYGAISIANRNGIILDVRVDFTWSQMGYVEHADVAKALRRFLKNFNEWCFYRKFDCAWLYVNEVGEKLGLHTHLMAAVPNEHRKEFRKWVRDFLKKQSRIHPMPPTAVHFDTRPSNQMKRQWRSFQYLCKGVSPCAVMKAANGDNVFLSDLIRRAYEYSGQMNCKRVGFSSHIGKSVRKKAGFKSLLDQGITDIDRLYGNEEYRTWQQNKTVSMTEVIASLDSIFSKTSQGRGDESRGSSRPLPMQPFKVKRAMKPKPLPPGLRTLLF